MPIQLPKFTMQGESSKMNAKARTKLYPKGISSSSFKRAWDQGFNGTGIRVAIIDTGIDGNHPDLRGKVIKHVNYTTERAIVHPHGTHVAGTICATGRKWLVGGAPGCSILSYKVIASNGGTIQSVVRAINQAVTDGATVINMSIGAEGISQNDINTLTTAINSAFSRGVVSVIAAGNSGTSICTRDPYSWPASVQAAESIAAVNIGTDLETISLAPFSNENDRVDAAACGVGVVSTVLRGLYGIYNGTSMATPHVSALAAVLSQKIKKQNPKLTGAAFSNALVNELRKNIKYVGSCSSITANGKDLITQINCSGTGIQVPVIESLEIYPRQNISFGHGFIRYEPTKTAVNPGGKQFYFSGIFLGHQI